MATQLAKPLTTDQFRSEVLRQLKAANQKLNLLVENAGLSDQLKEIQLAEQLRGPTDTLKAAVDANQPK